MAPPLVTLRDATVTFGGRPLFEGLEIALGADERACLVGRNGSGKSTLLKVLAGEVQLDGGERFVQPGTRIAYLPQEPRFGDAADVAAYIAGGLADPSAPDADARVAALLDRMSLDGAASCKGLSGGEARRADLARVFASEPDILLLDEPTNHLDIATIEWLEGELARFRGGLLLISHDRAFLRSVARRVFWLDRGMVRKTNRGYDDFDEWVEQVLAAEEQEAHKLGRKLAAETKWMREGISARRTRNQGRVRALQSLRKTMAERVRAPGQVKLEAGVAESGGTLVIEAERVSKDIGGKPIVRDFSMRILRGARIGLVGPNGAGKTTLLKLLTGQLAPDSGRVRLGQGLEIAYFDQRREALDPDATLRDTLTDGSGDQVFVAGKPRHVATYLREYLFEDRQINATVRSLSGGERSRLLLAKLFARPSNVMVLDEPTNDLDMDTLDLLQDALAEYPGTVLLVSHDRDFLDRVCTSVVAFEGNGRTVEYAGGYTDHLAQRPPPADAAPVAARTPKADRQVAAPKVRAKLSYKDERERSMLPDRLATLAAEMAKLEAELSDPGLYGRDSKRFAAATARLEAARAEHEAAEERWLELELMAEALGA